ncbi:hypothetical protein K8R14_04675 [bacterium]|nr:hypothetical protein [bacterium]
MKNPHVIEGSNKILISAPHVHIHRRPNLFRKYKLGEIKTNDIVIGVCDKSDSFGIYITKKTNYDPNYHKIAENSYKRKVENIIKNHKIEKFIDIHGLKEPSDIDLVIYYKTRFRKSVKLAQDLEKYINSNELEGINIQILRLQDNDQETLTEFVASTLRVPAVQIEVAKYIREDRELLESLIKNISEYFKIKS